MRHMTIFILGICTIGLLLTGSAVAQQPEPNFRAEQIDDNVEIGYGLALEDVNGDGRLDILLADKKQFVWYENPSWERHVMVENLTTYDNVCLAARDIDGDGKVEVAVGAQWNPSDTLHSGSVHYLIPPDDRRQKWTPVKLHHEPVVHRMRWVQRDEGDFVLVVAPLHGRGNRNGEGEGVRLLAYEMPKDPRQEWTTTVLENTLHVTHNFDVGQWDPTTPSEEILYIGREGAMLIHYVEGGWKTQTFPRVQGGGEIRMGLAAEGNPFLVTIEPLHGDQLALYLSNYDRTENRQRITEVRDRILLDGNLNAGHAIATADLLGTGGQQIVAGWRSPNSDGKVGLKIYLRTSPSGEEWTSRWIDEDGMATEDVRIADLNGDGRPDIVAAGRSTRNLKIYWNEPPGDN